MDCNPDQKESYVRDVALKLNISFVVREEAFLCPERGFFVLEADTDVGTDVGVKLALPLVSGRDVGT